MKKFEYPEIEVITIAIEDVIAASTGCPRDGLGEDELPPSCGDD